MHAREKKNKHTKTYIHLRTIHICIHTYICTHTHMHTKSAILHGEWGVEIGGLKDPGQDIGIISKISSKNYEIRSNIK